MIHVLRRIDDALAWLEDVLLAAAMAALSLILFVNVVFRYLFRSPFTWTEEVVVAIFSWVIFVGASACFRSHLHLRIDVLIRYLPQALAQIAALITVAVMFALLGLMVWFGYDYAAFVSGNRTPMLNISAAWLFAAMPVGMAAALVHILRQLFDEGPIELFKSVIELGEPEREHV